MATSTKRKVNEEIPDGALEDDGAEEASSATSESGGEDSSAPSESEVSDEDVDEDAPQIALDQHGRIVGAFGDINYNFQCYDKIFSKNSIIWTNESITSLCSDCRSCFTARAVRDSADYSDGETFFVRADTVPSTIIENFALSVFREHTKGMTFDPQRSGAEWWTLVVDADEGGVGFHWDKDYGMEEHGVSIFPHLATVTYLGDSVGSPTLVLQKTAPPMYDADVSGPCGSEAMLSWPTHGKHIVFDGRFLHAALPWGTESVQSSSSSSVRGKSRVSLLVNVWLNHLPRDAKPISTALKSKLSSTVSGVDAASAPQGKLEADQPSSSSFKRRRIEKDRPPASPQDRSHSFSLNFNQCISLHSEDTQVVVSEEHALEQVEWDFVHNDKNYNVRMKIPAKRVDGAGKSPSVVLLRFSDKLRPVVCFGAE